MENDHISNEFVDEVVGHLRRAGLNAHNEYFQGTFSVLFYHSERPEVGDVSALWGTANGEWASTGSVFTSFDRDEAAVFDEIPEPVDYDAPWWANSGCPAGERDPKVVALAVATAIVGAAVLR